MASSKKVTNKSQKARTDFTFRGFVEYNLSGEEKSFLKEQGVDHERLWDSACARIDAGFTFKFGYDDYNHCYQVSCTVKETTSESSGWFLVGRGSEPMKALRQCLYIGEQVGWDFAGWMQDKPKPREELDD